MEVVCPLGMYVILPHLESTLVRCMDRCYVHWLQSIYCMKTLMKGFHVVGVSCSLKSLSHFLPPCFSHLLVLLLSLLFLLLIYLLPLVTALVLDVLMMHFVQWVKDLTYLCIIFIKPVSVLVLHKLKGLYGCIICWIWEDSSSIIWVHCHNMCLLRFSWLPL